MASLLELGREYAPDQIPLPSLATIGQRDQLMPPPYDPKNYSRGAWKGLKDIGNTMIVEPGWELGGALQNIAEGQGIFGDYANAGMGVAGAVPAGAAAKGLGLAGGLAGKISPAIFAGIMAKTADRAALQQAERLAAKGAPKEQIWNETGWFKGGDDKWRFEIPDSTEFHLKAPLPESGETAWLGNVFNAPKSEAAYPTLFGGTEVMRQPLSRGLFQRGDVTEAGVISPHNLGVGPGATRSTVLHEFQHGIQGDEGFARGGNAMTLRPGTPGWDIYKQKLKEIGTPLSREQLEIQGNYGRRVTDAEYADYVKSTKAAPKKYDADIQRTAAQEAYRRMAGEVEARNVQKRMDMTPEQRRAAPPWTTEDVPRDQQIVRIP